jgi:hypothetical protein
VSVFTNTESVLSLLRGFIKLNYLLSQTRLSFRSINNEKVSIILSFGGSTSRS